VGGLRGRPDDISEGAKSVRKRLGVSDATINGTNRRHYLIPHEHCARHEGCVMTKVNVVATAADYQAALKRIRQLIAADAKSDDAELEALALLVENYEKRKYPIAASNPVDMIQFRMAELDIGQSEVARRTGIGRGHVSEILNGRRPLSLDAIRKISSALGLPVQLLVQPSASSAGGRRATSKAAG
jgi:HTH-type transcriptional regulator / antitoxin HigA